LLALLASDASAQFTSAGRGNVAGTYKAKLSGCGKDRGPASELVEVAIGGAWSEDGAIRTGTATLAGRSVLTISYDAATIERLREDFVALAASMCDAAFTMTSFQFSGTAKFNKRLTSVTVRKTFQFSGTTASGSHTGSRRQREKGPWFLQPAGDGSGGGAGVGLVADAGPDQVVVEGETVHMAGTVLSSGDGGSFRVSDWRQVAGPPVYLSWNPWDYSGTWGATFTAPEVDEDVTLIFSFEIEILSGKGIPADTVSILVRNSPSPGS
jgi:hypothetical protein